MKNETRDEETIALSPWSSRMRAYDHQSLLFQLRMQIPGPMHPSQRLRLPGILRSYCPVTDDSLRVKECRQSPFIHSYCILDEAKQIEWPDESSDVGETTTFKEVQVEQKKDLLELKQYSQFKITVRQEKPGMLTTTELLMHKANGRQDSKWPMNYKR